ncbi:right-handed parallel beta-helix repeat-containing protein (plasmid) [Natrinema zhouii]|uniref:right-handed parallel beta-helix repeat-containing protein n=1 Tax=Natrinema zhouii TaxID=1710539 RepID=UPI001CFFEEAC|nr:right-handed parallel beta-helix repeat-containing protein [Natrinema zhouii]UHQ98489.1 right-handed parallel beta-helix repeat-containing protein [Natrinema zhouii]
MPRRGALGVIGAAGLGAAFAGSASGQESSAGPDTGNQPWYEWDADVDANGHGLYDLHNLEVDHTYTSAREADVIVWEDEDGVYQADGTDGHVASSDDYLELIQAAVDSLTDGRTTKERVLVTADGTVEATNKLKQVVLPSYTVVDVPATIRVEDEGQSLVIPFRALNEEEIEIPRLNITGNPRFGIVLQNCDSVRLGHIDVQFDGLNALDPYEDHPNFDPPESFPPSHEPGRPREDQLADPVHVGEINEGVRISGRSREDAATDIQLDSAYIENANHHGVEFYDVERVQVGRVLGNGIAGCSLLLNKAINATVDSVVGYNPESETRYATFRVANEVENVSCGQVVSRDAPRGVHISDGRDITINTVNISNPRTLGIAADSTVENAVVQGGLIKNCAQEGIRSDTEGFAVSNVRVYDDRPEDDREQPVAIRVTGDHSSVVNCDVRNGGTEHLLDITADDTVVRNNIGDGIDSGTVTLKSDVDPAARIEGVSENPSATLDLRASAVKAPAGSCSWDHRFEWDGDAERWDLVFEWHTDPGADLDVKYIVDQPQANLGLERDVDWDHDTSPGIVDSFESGTLDAYDGNTDAYEITNDPPVSHGDSRLASDVGVAPIISTDGLDRYPAAGTTFSAKIGRTDDNPHMGVAFGAQSTDEFYFIRVSPDLDAPRFQLYSGSSGNLFSVEPTADIKTGTLYELVVDWGEDGEITATLFDPDGTEIASGSATNTDFIAGGIGTRGSALLDEIRILEE